LSRILQTWLSRESLFKAKIFRRWLKNHAVNPLLRQLHGIKAEFAAFARKRTIRWLTTRWKACRTKCSCGNILPPCPKNLPWPQKLLRTREFLERQAELRRATCRESHWGFGLRSASGKVERSKPRGGHGVGESVNSNFTKSAAQAHVIQVPAISTSGDE
jgi:hypothetical protein